MATEFYVVMVKRKAGKVYADLHKTDGKMYLIEDDANKALEAMGDIAQHYHVVPLVAMTVDEYQKADTIQESGK